MLKGKGTTSDGRPVLIIGLERGNIERLQAGQPIKFDMADVGIVGECVIVAGETAESIAADLGSSLAFAATAGNG